MNLSQLIISVLADHGVENLYGIPGDAINELTNALRRQDQLRFVGVRHEESGAFAASAEAKLSGALGACMGTAGPGAIHLLNGLYDAGMDHAPVIAITGQVETRHLGTDYHQEVDLEHLFDDVALYSRTITSLEQAPAVLLEACRSAISGRGVAHVSVPADLAGQSIGHGARQTRTAPATGTMHPCEDDLSRAVSLLDQAQSCAILAGIGCRGARAELCAFAEQIGAPIVRTLRAKDVIDDHPLCVGGLGLLGSEPGVEAMERCDLLVMVGTDFPYADFYPKHAKVIQIDRSPTRIGKRCGVDVGITGDAAVTLQALTERAASHEGAFLSRIQARMDQWLDDQAAAEHDDAVPIKPQRLMSEVARAADDDAIFVCDTGTVDAWSARHLRLRERQRYTLSSTLGSMAFALPGALGAKLRYPDRQVFALAGDGGLNMLLGDFATAVAENLPVICVLANNSKLGFIALEQQARGLPEHDVNRSNPDFAAFARSCGGLGIRVTEAGAIGAALSNALAAGQPTIIDVQVDPDELIVPPKVSAGDALNYAVARVRELVS